MNILPVSFGYKNISFARTNNLPNDKKKAIEEIRKELKKEGIKTEYDKDGLLVPLNPKKLSFELLKKYPIEKIMSCISPEAKFNKESSIPPALRGITSDDEHIDLDW